MGCGFWFVDAQLRGARMKRVWEVTQSGRPGGPEAFDTLDYALYTLDIFETFYPNEPRYLKSYVVPV